MLILTGNNLGERHRDFNAKIGEAVKNKINFDEVKSQDEKCDVDKLFKIELASRYKNIDYILEVLKSGDVFHITRALKSSWIYNDEYSNYISVSYLENNIFPHMSKKMKRKMLTSISMNLRNGERAIDFYKYCKEAKMKEYALKFLVFTPDTFKVYIMRDINNFDSFRKSKYLKQFIGKSLELARTYMSLYNFDNSVIHELRFLHSLSSEGEYLDILETFTECDTESPYNIQQFGIRISKDILKNHKRRVIERPLMYLSKLNINMLIKNLASEDIKALLPRLLPPSPVDFWDSNFYECYRFLIDIIPRNEVFAYLKEIFNSKYPGESFEMYIEFYKLGYFKMLTTDEQEEWALRHIERDRDLPGIEKFMWYSFVSFSTAFPAIKRYILTTPNKNKQLQIINILPKTVRNQDELAKMLNYYNETYVNEKVQHRESFINTIVEHNDIYSFNDECWTLLDKLFYSLDIYSTGPTIRPRIKEKSIFYRILHNKELPETLQEYLKYNRYPLAIYDLTKQQTDTILNYLSFFYAGKTATEQSSEESMKDDNDLHKLCPEGPDHDLTQERIKSDMGVSTSQENLKPKRIKKTEGDFLRWLKNDLQMATEGISEIRSNACRWNFRLSRLFRKLKVYFPNDVAKCYLQYFINYLSDVPYGYREYRNIKMAVVGVLYLADEDYKKEFLEKYVPETPKIDHMYVDRCVLQIQKAICRLAHHSRPSLPLSIIRKYIVGDYVHYCLPMFNNYMANWVCVKELTKSMLDSPLSVQKHGLRFAFDCYSSENLSSLAIDMWKKTRNVSLRKLLYQTLFSRMLREKDEGQKKLYEVLKLYTLDLNHDDHDEVYSLLVSEALPYHLKGDFIETAWLTVSKLPDKALDLTRKTSVIRHIEKHIKYDRQREFIRIKIIDDHIHDMLFARNIKRYYDTYEQQQLIDAKWSLTVKYLVTFDLGEERDSKKIQQQQSLELLRTILTKCFELWNQSDREMYYVRDLMKMIINMIMENDPMTNKRCGHMVPIYRCILNILKQSLKKEETYLIAWKLKLHMACRKILHNGPDMSLKEICYEFGKEVGELIIKLVEKDKFYHCFYESMASIVNNIGYIICNYYHEGHSGYYYYVSESLTDIKMNETHVIAIMILPTDDCSDWADEHAKAIRKIRKYDSKEIRSYLFQKYVASDNCVRGYMND